MPNTPKGPCLQPGCPKKAITQGRCKEHASERTAQKDAEYKPRSPQSRAVYHTKRWQVLRRQVLVQAGYMCSVDDCTNLATEVDHVTPIERGGDPYNPRNLQPLCKRHHSAKTMREVMHRKG